MRTLAINALAGLLLFAATPAAAMSVADFLAKAERLEARGVAALFSSDYRLLKAVGTAAGEGWRARVDAAAKAGAPVACPPPRLKLSGDQFLAALRGLPATRRTQSVDDAFYGLMNARYPCRR